MNNLLRFALWTCPQPFRSRYAPEVLQDYEDRGITSVPRICADLFRAGIALRTERFVRDVAFAARMLAKTPLYTGMALLTIALALGANVAVASVLESVLLRPLPYAQPDRLVFFSASTNGQMHSAISYLDAADVAARSRSFAASSITRFASATLTRREASVQLRGRIVGTGYFDVLGVRPLLGRYFSAADAGTDHAVIAEALWRDKFAADPHALGATLYLNGKPHTIVGVTQNAFRDPTPTGTADSRFWLPTDPHESSNTQRGWFQYTGIGRLAPGVDLAAARADLARIGRRLAAEHPISGLRGVDATPLLEGMVRDVAAGLWLLWGAVAVVLIIACANIANLHLVRAARRSQEFALRSALGASRAAIAGQLVTETALLDIIGGVLGVVLGWFALASFAASATSLLPRWDAVSMDATVLGYAGALIVLTTFLTGVLPAFTHGRRRAAGNRVARRVHHGIVVVEVALAMAIVVAAGLLVRSYAALEHMPLGFVADNVAVISVDGLALPQYAQHDAILGLAKRVNARLSALPGVEVSVAAWFPPAGMKPSTAMKDAGGRPVREGSTELQSVTPGYFQALRIPIVRGRDFVASDGRRLNAVVNAAFARRYFGTLDVLGKRFTPSFSTSTTLPAWTIVGVTGDTRDTRLSDVVPTSFMPLEQVPNLSAFIVRLRAPSAGFPRDAAAVFHDVDPLLPPPRVRPLTDLLALDTARSEFMARLFGLLALVALALALSGIYSVTAYTAQSRSHEFAIRKSVGARSDEVLRSVLLGALATGAVGAAIGTALLPAVSGSLSSVLYQIDVFDPVAITGAAAIVIACTALASAIPALRAMSTDVAVALRYE